MHDDQQSIDDLVARFFALFSNRDGVVPDLRRMFDLFVPEAVISKCIDPVPEVMTLESFIAPREVLLSTGTLTEFCEIETAHRTRILGHVAQRASTYTKTGLLNGTPFETHGVKLFQFIHRPEGWRIVSVSWDDEREGFRVPAEMASD